MGQKKICKYCDRETFNKNDDYCIFHSKDIEGKKNQFNEAFDEEFKLQDQEEDDFIFIYFIFPNDFDYFKRNTIKKNIHFHSAIFKGAADFMGVKFKGVADFEGATSEGAADFRGAKFKEGADFIEAKFKEGANFIGATFEGEAHFMGAKFKGGADFIEAKFKGGGNFGGATFKGEAYFEGAIFKEWADFRVALFKEGADFMGATFKEWANFSVAIFEGEANFMEATFKGRAYFGVKSINYNKLNLRNTFFYDLRGLLDQVEEGIKNNKLDSIYYINKSKKKDSNKILIKLNNWSINRFRITKFVNNKINPTLGERTYKRYPIIARTINDDNYLIRFKIKHPKLFFFWWLSADCGRSMLRWAIWAIIFALTFATKFYGVYCLHPEFFHFDPHIKSQSFLSFIYYSVVTFTTLGFGDIIPTVDKMQIWVMAEVVMGYIMLGGLISIFANKLARRS